MVASKESHRSFKHHVVQVAEESSKSNASHFILPPYFKKCLETFEIKCGMCPIILPSLVNNKVYIFYLIWQHLSNKWSPYNLVDMVASDNAIFLSVSIQ